MKNLSLCLIAALTLSACASTTPDMSSTHQYSERLLEAETYPVEAVLQKVATELDIAFKAETDGITLQISMIGDEIGQTTFNNESVRYKDYKMVFLLDNEPLFVMPATIYYDTAPYRYKGAKTADSAISEVVKNTDLPKYATLDSQGIYADEIVYKDETKAERVSRNVFHWSLTKASDTTAWLCESIESDAISFDYDESGKACYEIDKKGDILGGTAEMADPFGDEGDILTYDIMFNRS